MAAVSSRSSAEMTRKFSSAAVSIGWPRCLAPKKAKKMRLFLIYLVICAHQNQVVLSGGNNNDKSQALSKSHFEFSLDLYKTLLGLHSDQNNLVVSPFSVNLVLSMLFMGTSSNSNSSRQLRSIMHFDHMPYVDVHNGFKNVVNNFDKNYYTTKMNLAHGFYTSSDVTVSPVYDRALREFYHSNVEHMDFRNADNSLTQGLINEFIDDSTEGIVPEMLEEAPEPDSKLVAVDAILSFYSDFSSCESMKNL